MCSTWFLGDDQLGGDFTVGPTLRDESQDLDFPVAESCRPGRATWLNQPVIGDRCGQ
jgi:hypothetical protein